MIQHILSRPRLVVLVAAMLFISGVASYGSMARQEDPTFPGRAGLVTAIYPGAMAEVMERLVLEPLQDEIAQVEEVDDFTAVARTGVVLVSVSLRQDIYDTAPAWERVRQAMDRARRQFPDGLAELSLDDRVTGTPAAVLSVAGADSVVALSLAAERLKRGLAGLPGLSRIEIEGSVDQQITIALRDTDLARVGLSPGSVASQIAQRNQILPGGFIVSDGLRITLLANSEFSSLDEMAASQITLPDRRHVPLSALADLWRGPLEPMQPATYQDGERVVALSIHARSNEIDAINFGRLLRERVDTLRTEFEPMVIQELFFQPDQVEQRLSDLMRSLLLSMLIITVIVFLGMGLRMGILVASVLPVVTVITLGIYNLGNGVLHQIAVIGMVISLGILIDNAIVMIENVQNRINAGDAPASAARAAVGELAGPLGSSTGTTLAAFTPLLLSTGGTADFTRGIPVMIMLTLSVSYIIAISLAPLLAAWFLKPAPTRRSAWFDALGAWLASISQRAPRRIIAAGLAIVVASLYTTTFLNVQFFPNADRPQVVVEMFLAEGTDQAHTDAVSADLERTIREQGQVVSVHRFVGFTGPGFYYNLPNSTRAPNRARLVVNLETLSDTGTFISWIRQFASESLPDIEVTASTLAQGPPRVAPVEVRVYHADDRTRLAAAEQIFQIIKNTHGAVDVRHDIDLGTPVLQVTVDDATAERYGINRGDVARTLFGRSLGITAEQYRQELDPIPIVVRSHEGLNSSTSQILSSYVYNALNDAVPLSLVASVSADWQPAAIQHRNGQRVYSITSGLAEGYSFSQILASLNSELGRNPLPPGTRIELGGDAEGAGDANRAIFNTAPIGILLLLFFLLLQFNSFTRVGIVLLTVPLAAAGIFPGLVLSNSPFGFQPLLGIIALVGIVVNNAIVLLDLIDQRLKIGVDIDTAVTEAVTRRTRPILLTTATTIAGLLPLALSSSTLWPPMAWAIISGLLASTIQTLLVVPAVCRLTLGRGKYQEGARPQAQMTADVVAR